MPLAVNLANGERRALGLAATRPPARVGDRFVLRRRPRHQEDNPWLDTVTFDEEDPRPFLTVSEPCSVMSVHIAHLSASFA